MKCETCDGGGKVDSAKGKPWHIVSPGNPAVRSGEVLPVDCPDCDGRGSSKPVPSAPDAPQPAPPAGVVAPNVERLPAKPAAAGAAKPKG